MLDGFSPIKEIFDRLQGGTLGLFEKCVFFRFRKTSLSLIRMLESTVLQLAVLAGDLR